MSWTQLNILVKEVPNHRVNNAAGSKAWMNECVHHTNCLTKCLIYIPYGIKRPWVICIWVRFRRCGCLVWKMFLLVWNLSRITVIFNIMLCDWKTQWSLYFFIFLSLFHTNRFARWNVLHYFLHKFNCNYLVQILDAWSSGEWYLRSQQSIKLIAKDSQDITNKSLPLAWK